MMSFGSSFRIFRKKIKSSESIALTTQDRHRLTNRSEPSFYVTNIYEIIEKSFGI